MTLSKIGSGMSTFDASSMIRSMFAIATTLLPKPTRTMEFESRGQHLLRVRVGDHRAHRVRHLAHVGVGQRDHGRDQGRGLILVVVELVRLDVDRAGAEVRSALSLERVDLDDRDVVLTDLGADEVADDHHHLEEGVEAVLLDRLGADQAHAALLQEPLGVLVPGELTSGHLLARLRELEERHALLVFPLREVEYVGAAQLLDQRKRIVALEGRHGRRREHSESRSAKLSGARERAERGAAGPR